MILKEANDFKTSAEIGGVASAYFIIDKYLKNIVLLEKHEILTKNL